ncbi:hypothetical protein [Lapillicoccus sp.]|uniref:hypothetical protein n=1 Tax=Lapillicoccus sp. TaxID=1909287 RepID=UPI0025FE4AB9|nr:hypothetical protein [Lapillicoccus sp.]
MSVARYLGLTDPDIGDLAVARQRWTQWRSMHEALQVVDDLRQLPGWLSEADCADADGVLLAMAQLSAPDGGDDVVATSALAWLLVPGASLLAHRLGGLSSRVDELVAAQLWMEARTFPWRRGWKVAANVLMNTRKGVLRDLGIGVPADQTWAHTVPVEPTADVLLEAVSSLTQNDAVASTPEQELQDVFTGAMAKNVVTRSDVELLLALARAADESELSRSTRGHGGLMSLEASDAVASARGVCGRTVRRHAARSVRDLRVHLHVPAERLVG